MARSKRWEPGKVLAEIAYEWQEQVSQQIRGSRPRKPHSPPHKGPVGGSLGEAVKSRRLVRVEPSYVVIDWLGTPLRPPKGKETKPVPVMQFFYHGTKERKGRGSQPARKFKLAPPKREIEEAVERDAQRFFAALDREGRPGSA